jgi:hypothetical protein
MVYFANFNTLPYVRLTFLHNQTRWATCFICVLFRITGIARVDGVICATDPIFASGRSRVFDVCFPYEVIRRMTCSIQDEHVMGCDVATFLICVHFACRICESRIHSIQTEGVRGWTLSMQRLDAWIPLLLWMVMYEDTSVTCWHGRFIFCRYTNYVS